MDNKMDNNVLLKELREKYSRDEIYSNVSKVLVALNPFKELRELYSLKTMNKYRGVLVHNTLQPHVFALAHEVVRNLRVCQKSQSIIIAGETASGKTETSKYILNFLGGSTKFAEMMFDSSILLEAFGNSPTPENSNSSRFVKLVKISYGTDYEIAGLELCAYLLESNRSCLGSYETFHVFHYLLYGSPESLRERTGLNLCANFHLVKQLKPTETQSMILAFEKVDTALNSLGLGKEAKSMIYEFLASILHLGNIELTSVGPQVEIMESSRIHLSSVAKLLKIDSKDLEKTLLFHTIEVNGDEIVSPLNILAARKCKDTIMKIIYLYLFKFIISTINYSLRCKSSELGIFVNILDIAGFETFEENQFEQFCINYTNEKVQNYCTKRLITEEQEWYKIERVDVPEIKFPGNDITLNLLENKITGIFSLLDNECRMRSPNIENFIENVKSTHSTCSAFTIFPQKGSKCPHRSFVIQHFDHKVNYTTDFRPGKQQSLDKLKQPDICRVMANFRKGFAAFMRRVLYVRFMFLGVLLARLKRKKRNQETMATKNRTLTSMLSCEYKSSLLSVDSMNESAATLITQSENADGSQCSDQMDLPEAAEHVTRKMGKKNTKGTKKEKMPVTSVRFSKQPHFPMFDDPTQGRKGIICKKEGCGMPSPVYCETCGVHLCFIPGKKNRNCFRDFHLIKQN